MSQGMLKQGVPQTWMTRVTTYGRMIKFSHTVFALPFALVAAILVWRQVPVNIKDTAWIVLAMVSARSAAMGFNRVIDAPFDGKNPRTNMREIPSGRISAKAVWLFTGLSALFFIFATAMLGRQCLALAIPVLAILFFYSLTKRFTWLSHFFLGLAISLAPWGTWVALTKTYTGPIWILSLALLTYIAGFDILYACQDVDFDRKEGLQSIPARFGVAKALAISTGFHVITFGALATIYFVFKMGPAYAVTVALIGILLIIEHCLVHPDNLAKIHMAFFHLNSLISVVLLLGVLVDEFV